MKINFFKKKQVIKIGILFFIFFLFYQIKIDFKRDLIWNLKSNLSPNIIIHLKKIYLYYHFNIKKEIKLYKTKKIIDTKFDNFELTKYSNKFFLKNGPKAYIAVHQNNVLIISGTGILSWSALDDLNQEEINLKILKTNLEKILTIKKIVKNPKLITGMKVYKDKIFLTFVNEKNKDCYNTSILYGDLNYKKIDFKFLFNPNDCVNKLNDYGEFNLDEAGGALEFINNDTLVFSTGAFKYRDLSQNKNSIFGKIILFNLKKQKYNIIGMGVRNVYGIMYDSRKNRLLFTDHGPQGGDEINILSDPSNKLIKNYGWPIASYGEHYGGKSKINENKYLKAPLFKSHKLHGFIEPFKVYLKSIAPSKIITGKNLALENSDDKIYISSLGFNDMHDRRSVHIYSQNSKGEIYNKKVIHLSERIRDMIYLEKKILMLFLESSGSISFLRSIN